MIRAWLDMSPAGIFLSLSHDALGNRLQIWDRNWTVVEQEPPAGTAIRPMAVRKSMEADRIASDTVGRPRPIVPFIRPPIRNAARAIRM